MNYETEAFWNGTKVERRYPNYFECLLNTDQFYPENEHAELHTRIVTSPIHANALLETIQKDPLSSMKRALGLSIDFQIVHFTRLEGKI